MQCEKVLEYEEQLEKLFMQKLDVADIERRMCFGEITQACVGVDAKNPQNRDPSVYIDGEKTETVKVPKKPAAKKPKKKPAPKVEL